MNKPLCTEMSNQKANVLRMVGSWPQLPFLDWITPRMQDFGGQGEVLAFEHLVRFSHSG